MTKLGNDFENFKTWDKENYFHPWEGLEVQGAGKADKVVGKEQTQYKGCYKKS